MNCDSCRAKQPLGKAHVLHAESRTPQSSTCGPADMARECAPPRRSRRDGLVHRIHVRRGVLRPLSDAPAGQGQGTGVAAEECEGSCSPATLSKTMMAPSATKRGKRCSRASNWTLSSARCVIRPRSCMFAYQYVDGRASRVLRTDDALNAIRSPRWTLQGHVANPRRRARRMLQRLWLLRRLGPGPIASASAGPLPIPSSRRCPRGQRWDPRRHLAPAQLQRRQRLWKQQ